MSGTNSIAQQIFNQLPTWLPEAAWSNPKPATETTFYGEEKGLEESAVITTQTASVPHFEDPAFLENLGFTADTNLSADGPGASMWGYKKENNGKMQIVTFSYKTTPTSSDPDEPVQFNCPCQTTVTTFVSE